MLDDNFESEIESLKLVLNRLDDAAMASLRSFIEEKDPSFRSLEKRIHRARRGLIRAIGELEGMDGTDNPAQID